MTRDELMKEMVRVAEALERPGLKADQLARGRAKYDELESKLNEMKQVEASIQHPEHIGKHLNKIRETLAKKP